MTQETVSDAIRHDLALLARRNGARNTRWTKERPTSWRPRTVKDPSSGDPFTAEGAWQFIADLLDSGHPIEPMILEKPPGKRAYVMKVDLDPELPRLYIKLELGCGVIYGRSFHYSETEASQENHNSTG